MTPRDLEPVGHVSKLPDGKTRTGPLGPLEYLSTLQQSEVMLWEKDKQTVKEEDGSVTTVYRRKTAKGSEILRPGNLPAFKGIRSDNKIDKLNFLSLMLALFGGTASLPHILIRYYTVKDQASRPQEHGRGHRQHRVLLRADALSGPGRDDQRRDGRHQQQHGRAAAGQELRRIAVRDHLGDRLHDRAGHGERADHRRQRRGGPRPDGQASARSK